jgi:uridine kinase
MTRPKFVGIAGGTGAGKSSLCTALLDAYPDTIGMVQLDDYFRPATDVPQTAGFENWDHPDSLYLDRLAHDLRALFEGETVTIMTKNERLNPEYAVTDERIPVRFDPKPIMLVEGFLVLYDPRIREMLATSIWLEAPHDDRYARRVHFKVDGYEEAVLRPMQEEYAEPTKKYAEHIFDVSMMTKDDVFHKAEQIILSL